MTATRCPRRPSESLGVWRDHCPDEGRRSELRIRPPGRARQRGRQVHRVRGRIADRDQLAVLSRSIAPAPECCPEAVLNAQRHVFGIASAAVPVRRRRGIPARTILAEIGHQCFGAAGASARMEPAARYDLSAVPTIPAEDGLAEPQECQADETDDDNRGDDEPDMPKRGSHVIKRSSCREDSHQTCPIECVHLAVLLVRISSGRRCEARRLVSLTSPAIEVESPLRGPRRRAGGCRPRPQCPASLPRPVRAACGRRSRPWR